MTDEIRLESFHKKTDCFLYEFFGCHKISDDEYLFRVWAPHAVKVCLLGSFNGCRKIIVMRKLFDGESFEAVTEATEGDKYKFLIYTADGRELYKTDPFAFEYDYPDCSYAKVCSLSSWEVKSFENPDDRKPLNIYEVNLLSWKRHKNNSYYTYPELEKVLVPYVKRMGYTHVEFMPVTEFPYDGSWGYQVTGYFAVTSRLGSPEQFKNLINAFHNEGIGVILDWVPAHFPKDDWGVYEFDGQPLYECPLWDRMEHSGWGTRRFDFGRNEVDNFLLSSAIFFLDKYNIDGLRVDAVASMLYLDYDRNGDWTPNKYGDNRNLEAIEFIKKFNTAVKQHFPSALVIAEESTTFPDLTKPVECGGLGFDYKWNMGWMNDVLFYCRQDPYFRNHHHNKITFSMVYAFSEKYILPVSHDEVVHVKGSVVNKMPGEYENKFAGERAFLGFMYAHPGKKLNFMGYEIAQFSEWNYEACIEFFLKKFTMHRKMSDYVKFLNHFYSEHKPLYEIDDSWDGFKWLVVDDNYNNLIAFNRYSRDGNSLTAIINFSGVDIKGYKIDIEQGSYRVVLNSDSKAFGGSGTMNKRIFKTVNQSGSGKDYCIYVDIPKLTCIYLIKKNILGDSKC